MKTNTSIILSFAALMVLLPVAYYQGNTAAIIEQMQCDLSTPKYEQIKFSEFIYTRHADKDTMVVSGYKKPKYLHQRYKVIEYSTFDGTVYFITDSAIINEPIFKQTGK